MKCGNNLSSISINHGETNYNSYFKKCIYNI
nr:MAG TPA: hypothetical protein [Caudoviricetes sp.]